ncbi:urease accessory protein UreD [Brevibacillus dissolubilis]|uniref:urease accessory protein UreD n=1 Tax=Brevibacillus dissolubilis TaxID=1844116 RepID=UPI001117396D|nr:urease accessory protein UreD [Brevibacillus dissolubilis]
MRVNGSWSGVIGLSGGRSFLAHSHHQAPMKTAKPFVGPDGELILYLMDSSPGLFNGDKQEITCTLEAGAELYLTNQSSCKLHPSVEVEAGSRQVSTFYVGEGAFLEYRPEPLVPYQGSRHEGETVVHLATGGQAVVSEIITPGRVGHGEVWAYERMMSRLSVYWDGELAVWDSLLLEPKSWETSLGLLGEYTHVATLWVLSEQVSGEHLRLLQEFLAPCKEGDVYAGVSRLSKNGLVVRLLGRSVWQLEKVMQECWEMVSVEMRGKGALKVRK